MRPSFWLFAGILAGPTLPASLVAQVPPAAPALRITVDASDAPGATVTLRYLIGPDSLRGKSVQVVVPTRFTLAANELALVAERPGNQGTVSLRVVRASGTRLTGEGSGDRVYLHVWPDSVKVRTVPWRVPI